MADENVHVENQFVYHGLSNSPEYLVWNGMVTRCTNKKHQFYSNYGGRGITVCPEWIGPGGFANFIAYMGRRPTKKHELDRIDNLKGYEPGNVTWVTRDKQANNKRNNRLVTAFGITQTLSQWANDVGIPYPRIQARLNRGWTPEDAITIHNKAAYGQNKQGVPSRERLAHVAMTLLRILVSSGIPETSDIKNAKDLLSKESAEWMREIESYSEKEAEPAKETK